MNRKMLLFIIVIFVLVALFLRFSGTDNPVLSTDEQITLLESRIEMLTIENTNLKQQIDDNNQRIQSQSDVLEALKAQIELLLDSENGLKTGQDLLAYRLKKQVELITTGFDAKDLLAVYSGDIDSYEPVVLYYVQEETKLNTLDNLNLLAQILSTEQFNNLPITIVKIDEENILHVDLSETPEENNPIGTSKTWQNFYFQGSTGGMITTITLMETFLQKSMDSDDWIDGVVFSYEGEYGYLSDHVEYLFDGVHVRETK
ncbi:MULTISPECIES: hypothetical protein [unclassified Fusibacter]|uniref:hypothetical protein n=1 Tax=unclassified Fusibacter TaxID=2624464 RepID=UPI001011C0E3|nr:MULTISPECIES: hypothetical protein [unclassified Fusibacter]MCK8061565.1 hypothetical protein [Fusibacter sp. A2]NPE23707.1 hypothetical protein [Fusibacter sp. A1]RXV58734.1 hypothetical protein DWB64_18140 [Fusibacter sp. A1]